MEQDPAIKRLLWRCRRGTKELDLLLSGFVDKEYTGLDQGEKKDFDLLLETQDPVLTDWLCYDSEPPVELRSIVDRIRKFSPA